MKENKNKEEKKTTSKEEDKKKSIVGSFLGSVPLLGDFFKELGKTELFKEKFKEADEKIKENLKKGERKKWAFETNISIRPIINAVKKETSEITIKEDYFYGKKGNKLTLAVKVPTENVGFKIERKNLIIENGNLFLKKIELPDYFKEIKTKQYQDGILVLELTK